MTAIQSDFVGAMMGGSPQVDGKASAALALNPVVKAPAPLLGEVVGAEAAAKGAMARGRNK